MRVRVRVRVRGRGAGGVGVREGAEAEEEREEQCEKLPPEPPRLRRTERGEPMRVPPPAPDAEPRPVRRPGVPAALLLAQDVQRQRWRRRWRW